MTCSRQAANRRAKKATQQLQNGTESKEYLLRKEHCKNYINFGECHRSHCNFAHIYHADAEAFAEDSDE